MRISDWSSDVCSSDLYQVALGHPGHRPVDDFGVLLLRADDQLRRQQFAVDQLAAQVVAQAVLVAPLVLLAAGIVEQAHGQAGAEHGLGAQQVAQRAQVELRGVEVLRIRPEAQPGAGVALRSEEHTSELQSLMRNSYAVFCLK